MTDFSIIEYDRKYQPDFQALNAAWIEQFYVLEEEDKRFLANPEGEIIQGGGMVFFLLDGGKVAGTCGVMKMDEGTYELVRMAVDEHFRGKGYGVALVRHAIEWVKQRGATQVILETGEHNKSAVALYEKLGFAHYTPDAKHRSGLARASIFMRFPLDQDKKAA